jgi:hypothetical protein
MAEEKNAKKAIEPSEETTEKAVDYSALANGSIKAGDDVNKAASANAFKLGIVRILIKLKNHIAYIPLLLTVISMGILTFTIRDHAEALATVANGRLNPFFLFCNVLLSILSILLYMNATSPKSSKKKSIGMYVLYFLFMLCQILIEVHYMLDIKVETSMVNATVAYSAMVSRSYNWSMNHMIWVIVTIVFAALAPVFQPLTKKIRIHL